MSLAENSPFFFVVAKNPWLADASTNVTFTFASPLPASSVIFPATSAFPRHGATVSFLRASPACMPLPR